MNKALLVDGCNSLGNMAMFRTTSMPACLVAEFLKQQGAFVHRDRQAHARSAPNAIS